MKISSIILSQTTLISRTDSLQHEIRKLKLTIDSLHDSANKFGIAKDYFHDIINTDVATFIAIIAIIITVAGFFSWKQLNRVTTKVKKDLSKQLKNQEKQLNEFGSNFKDRIETFEANYNNMLQRTNRLMYFGSFQDKRYAASLYWALQCVYSDLKHFEGKKAEMWLKLSIRILDSHLSKADLQKNFKEVISVIDEIVKLNNENVNKEIELIRLKCNTLIYSIAQQTD